MLCDRVLGRWDEQSATPQGRNRLDWLDLEWGQCHRRSLQVTSRRGRNVRLLLGVGTILRHHDTLADTHGCLLVVQIRPVETLVVRPRTIQEAAIVAAEWGNLHVPIQIEPDVIITLLDGPAEAAVAKHDLPATVEMRRFEPMPISGVKWAVAAS